MFCKCCLGDTSKASCVWILGLILGLPLLWPLPPPCCFTSLFCLFWRSQPFRWQLSIWTGTVLSFQAVWALLLLLNYVLDGYLSTLGDWGISKLGGKRRSLIYCRGITNSIWVLSSTSLFISELCSGEHQRRRLCVWLAKHHRNWKHNKLTVFWRKWEMIRSEISYRTETNCLSSK